MESCVFVFISFNYLSLLFYSHFISFLLLSVSFILSLLLYFFIPFSSIFLPHLSREIKLNTITIRHQLFVYRGTVLMTLSQPVMSLLFCHTPASHEVIWESGTTHIIFLRYCSTTTCILCGWLPLHVPPWQCMQPEHHPLTHISRPACCSTGARSEHKISWFTRFSSATS